MQATTKFQDTFWKFDRAADHFSGCVETVECHRESKQLEDFAKFLDALNDIPLYLDLMLFYLRIQADCLANVIPYLYEQRPQIAERSFRDKAAWFTKTQPDFDYDYAAILQTHWGWFEALAGKNSKGLRDLVVHLRGTYQLGWAQHDEPSGFEFRASVVSDASIVQDNIVPILRSINQGYFGYLDQTYDHFATRLRAEFGEELIPVGDVPTQYYRFEGGPLPSFWVYPMTTSNSE